MVCIKILSTSSFDVCLYVFPSNVSVQSVTHLLVGLCDVLVFNFWVLSILHILWIGSREACLCRVYLYILPTRLPPCDFQHFALPLWIGIGYGRLGRFHGNQGNGMDPRVSLSPGLSTYSWINLRDFRGFKMGLVGVTNSIRGLWGKGWQQGHSVGMQIPATGGAGAGNWKPPFFLGASMLRQVPTTSKLPCLPWGLESCWLWGHYDF